jgi:hypothetical protein
MSRILFYLQEDSIGTPAILSHTAEPLFRAYRTTSDMQIALWWDHFQCPEMYSWGNDPSENQALGKERSGLVLVAVYRARERRHNGGTKHHANECDTNEKIAQ